jgi:hypothetical protein
MRKLYKSRRRNKRGGTKRKRALTITYTYQAIDEHPEGSYPGKQSYKVTAILHGKEIGYFHIKPGNNETWDMHISVDDEYQGLGISAYMIHTCCTELERDGIFEDDQNLYIDANANDDFWRGKLKMRDNPTYDSAEAVEGAGYELVLTFGQLREWAGSSLARYRKQYKN